MEHQDISQQLRDQLALVLSEYYRTLGSKHDEKKPLPPFFKKWKSIIDIYDIVKGKNDIVKGKKTRIIGVYGTPKMGKSTLLNSLVQEDILPRGIKPVTGSVINMERDQSDQEYFVTCFRTGDDGKETLFNVYQHPNVAKVREYLDRVAGQTNPSDRVEVRGPFPNALAFFQDKYKLRDTPGAISKEDAKSANLSRDSRRAIQSMEEVCLPLFCVSYESLQEKNHVQYYRDFFADRICIFVITKCDDLTEEDRLEIHNTILNDYGIKDDTDIPLIYTGKKQKEDPYITQESCEILEKEIQYILSKDYVEKALRESCKRVVDLIARGSIEWPVPKVTLKYIQYLLNQR